MRELTSIKIEKISIVGAPANRKGWVMKKSKNGTGPSTDDEVMAAVAEYLGVDIDVEKADKDKLLTSLKALSTYRDIMPDDMAEAVDEIVSHAAAAHGIEPDPVIKAQELDPNDPWARIPFAVPGHLIKKSEEDLEDEDLDPDPVDELDHDPVIGPLRRIEKKLAGINNDDEPEDPWPSLDPITPGVKIAVKKSQPVRKVDPDLKQKAIKKGLGVDELQDDDEIIKKADDEDHYPSIPDGLFELP